MTAVSGNEQHVGVRMTGEDGEDGPKAFLIKIEAKPGREEAVRKMLSDIRACVEDEPETGPWFSVQLGPSSFAIFEAFPSIKGRDAHVAGGGGKIFRDLERMNDLLREPAHVQKADVLFVKQLFASSTQT